MHGGRERDSRSRLQEPCEVPSEWGKREEKDSAQGGGRHSAGHIRQTGETVQNQHEKRRICLALHLGRRNCVLKKPCRDSSAERDQTQAKQTIRVCCAITV